MVTYKEIKTYENIQQAFHHMYNCGSGNYIKFKKPSKQVDWYYRCCRALIAVKFLKTIEMKYYEIQKTHHIKYKQHLLWDDTTIQFKEDKANYELIITHGVGPRYDTKATTFFYLFEELYRQMRIELPEQKRDYIIDALKVIVVK